MISPLTLPPPAQPGHPIRAAHWNALLDTIRAALPQLRISQPCGAPPHPWQITLRPDEPADRLDIHITPGLINDTLPAIHWAIRNDPRGPLPEPALQAWQTARAAAPSDPWLAHYHDRPLADTPPPFLRLPLDPAPPDTPWRPATRPPAWIASSLPPDTRWHTAGVVLASFRYNTLTAVPMPKRWRLFAGRPDPAALRSAATGEVLQLARIWQARSPSGRLLTLRPQQRVWWHLSARASTPRLDRVPDYGPGQDPSGGLFSLLIQTANTQIANIEAGLTTTEFWTT